MAYTALQSEVRREVRRIQKFVRRAEQRGFEFDQRIKDIKFNKRGASTRRLEQLRKLTPEKLYEKSKYASEKTYGEIVSGKRGRELERQEAARKGAETKRKRATQQEEYYPTADILDTVEQMLMDLPSTVYIKGKQVNVSNYKNPCINIFYMQMNRRGRTAYAEYLNAQDELFEYLSEIQYSDSDLDKVVVYFTRIATLLKGSSLDMEELSNVEDMYDNIGW